MTNIISPIFRELRLLFTNPSKIEEIKVKSWKLALIFTVALIFQVIWSYTIYKSGFWLKYDDNLQPTAINTVLNSNIWLHLYTGVIMLPMFEEFIFRYPLKIKNNTSFFAIFPMIAMSAILIIGNRFGIKRTEFINSTLPTISAIPLLTYLAFNHGETDTLTIKQAKERNFKGIILTILLKIGDFSLKMNNFLLNQLKPFAEKYVVIISIILFTTLHATNFNIKPMMIVPVLFTLLVTHLPGTIIYSYFRIKLKNGMFIAILAHALYNLSVFLISRVIS
jgi:membrane protease YdiL (CAAX protease family)